MDIGRRGTRGPRRGPTPPATGTPAPSHGGGHTGTRARIALLLVPLTFGGAMGAGFVSRTGASAGPAADLNLPNRYAVQLHLHGSISELGGRMIHMAERNREIGVELLWWTDHEAMTWTPDFGAASLAYDFETGTLTDVSRWLPERGFYPLEGDGPFFTTGAIVDTSAASGAYAMAVVAVDGADSTGAPRYDGLRYETWARKPLYNFYARPLFNDVSLTVALRPEGDPVPGRRFSVRCVLSETLDAEPRIIHFLEGPEPLPPDAPPVYYRSLGVLRWNEWNTVSLPLSEIARALDAWGVDQHIDEISFGWRVEADGYSSMLVDDLSISITGPVREELLALQQAFLDSLPDPSPAHFVGLELSPPPVGAPEGHHINIYSPYGYPELPDWYDPRYRPGEYPENVIRWAHSKGYTVSYNHMFGATMLWITDFAREWYQRRLVDRRGYGADLLEVGYTQRGRPIEDFMAAWDELLTVNALLTGVGVTDAHQSLPWDEAPNRFITWVAAGQLDRAELLDGLLRGRACFGDPVVVGADAYLTIDDFAGRFHMGDVVLVTPPDTLELTYRGRFAVSPADLSLITVGSDGADTLSTRVTWTTVEGVVPLVVTGDRHVRLEVRDGSTGALVLGSNPIHFRTAPVDPGNAGMRLRRTVDLR